MQTTSLSVYFDTVKPTIGLKQQTIFIALQMSKRPVCNQELSDYLKMPINSITPRILELRTLNKVELAFKAVYPVTGRMVCYWKTKG